jgi:hypothetical protein
VVNLGEKTLKKKQHTVIYTIEVTEVVSSDTDFLVKNYGDIVKEHIKAAINADDVHLTSYKVFVHDETLN